MKFFFSVMLVGFSRLCLYCGCHMVDGSNVRYCGN